MYVESSAATHVVLTIDDAAALHVWLGQLLRGVDDEGD